MQNFQYVRVQTPEDAIARHRHVNELDRPMDRRAQQVGDVDHVAHVDRLDHVLMVGVAVAEVEHELDPIGHMVRKAAQDRAERGEHLVAVTAITLGIALQIKALAELLSRESLAAHRYDRAVRIFLTGLILVAIGVVLAIFAEVLGVGGNIL